MLMLVPAPRTTDVRTDEELLRDFAARGDDAALGEVVGRHWPRAVGLALRLLGDAAAAEDCAQEAFVRLAAAAGRLREGAPLRPWLDGFVVNAARESRRALARRARHERGASEARSRGAAEAPGGEGLARLLAAEVEEGVLRLPLDVRAAIVLRFAEERSLEEVARALDCPVGTASSRIRRGLERLREELAGLGCVAPLEAIEAALSGRGAAPGEGAASAPSPARPGPSAAEILRLAARRRWRAAARLLGGAAAAGAAAALALWTSLATTDPGAAAARGSLAAAPSSPPAAAARASSSDAPRDDAPAPPPSREAPPAAAAPSSAAPAPAVEDAGEETGGGALVPASLEGRVVEEGTGLPLPGARVRLIPEGTAITWTTVRGGEIEEVHPVLQDEFWAGPGEASSDAAGAFRFAEAPARCRGVIALLEGYTPGVREFEGGSAPTETAIRLSRSAEVRVRARDAAGRPVPGARARWRTLRSIRDERFCCGELAREAPGVLRGTVASGQVRISVAAPGFVTARREEPAGGGALVEVEVALARGRPLSVAVVGPDGRPVPGGRVSVEGKDAADGGGALFRLDGRRIGDEDGGPGIFDLGTVPLGPLAIRVYAPGFAPWERVVDVAEGGPPEVRAALEPDARQPDHVGGVVRDRAGRGLAGVTVVASWEGELGRATTDAEGRFRLEGLRARELVWVALEGRRAGRTMASPGAEVVLYEPPLSIDLRLSREDGAAPPPSSVRVHLARLDGGQIGTETVEEGGLLRLPADSPGPYDLAIEAEGFAWAILPDLRPSLEEGAPPLEVRLAPPAAAEGRVVAEDGSPVRGATVRAVVPPRAVIFLSHRDGFVELPSVTTGEDGRWALGALPAGCELEASAAGRRTARFRPALRPGATSAQPDVVLPPEGALR